jgi:hypothetical protein
MKVVVIPSHGLNLTLIPYITSPSLRPWAKPIFFFVLFLRFKGKEGKDEKFLTTPHVEITNTTERGGGVNQLSLSLNNLKSFKIFLIFLQVIINIIQHMDSKSKKHQSHIRYTQRQIFTRKPIKGENLFFFKIIGSLLSSVHHL